MPETAKTSYKKTLNLPKTSFPMRAGLTQHEPESLARWDQFPDTEAHHWSRALAMVWSCMLVVPS